MFARVITAQAGAEGFDGAIRLAEQQLPGARQMPGFKGYYLLTDAETGKLVIISLWETREQMDAVTSPGRAVRHPGTAQPTKSRCMPEPQGLHITPPPKRFPDGLSACRLTCAFA
jgi:Antibiotic biosynthesis monooxygenase